MIIVKLWGGIGNQLFQYSFGKYLSKYLNTEVKYDIQTIQKAKNFTKRSLGILDFNIHIEIASKEDNGKLKYFSKGIFARIERKLSQKLPFLFKTYFVESELHSRIDKSNIKDNCYYDGYWQSYHYLNQIESIISTEIILRYPLSKNCQSLISAIKNTESISIHIRRGDYINIKKNFDRFGVCSKHYYESSIQYISKLCENPIFYIFSDDINWAKENFIGSQYCFVYGNLPSEDMYLMSQCKHNIIANSTFSWWGAWLNNKKDKTIIAPANWYNMKQNNATERLIPETWNLIKN